VSAIFYLLIELAIELAIELTKAGIGQGLKKPMWAARFLARLQAGADFLCAISNLVLTRSLNSVKLIFCKTS
jgi:hypothetical protein